MVGVITGDIIESKKNSPELWLSELKSELEKIGTNPGDWEIYRGDSFQLQHPNPEEMLSVAITLKATMRKIGQDVRMAVGIGEVTFRAANILESNGSAFIHSGEKFELLKKEKQNLAVRSPWPEFDREINLLLRLGLKIMDKWTANDAEIIKNALANPGMSQEQLGAMIGIRQNAVSGRLKRACYDEIIALNERYKEQLKVRL
jgi:hypothetical protein